MTTTQQHIEDLDRDAWAALTKRAAATAVAAAGRLGTKPPAVLAAMAAMTEHDLVEHRNKFGPAKKRLSPLMQLVEADQLRIAAERRALEAQQDHHDAEAAASLVRAEAEQSARAHREARERARAAETQAASKEIEWADERAAARQALEKLRAELGRVRADSAAEAAVVRELASAAEARAEQGIAERVAERAAAEQTLQEVRAELERVRADATAKVAEAHEKVRAAEARAEQRIAERVAERAAAEQTLQEVRAEVERLRADTAAEVAAAHEKVRAADARAVQRFGERAADRAVAQEALQQVRAELERVRADAAAEVAAARGQLSGEIEAGHRAVEAEVSRARAEANEGVARSQAEVEQVRADAAAEVAAVREAAEGEIATAREAAEGEIAAAREAAQAEVARARTEADEARLAAAAQTAAPELLTIPIPPVGVRAHTGRIEDALSAVFQIDYVLEAGRADDAESTGSVDVEVVRSLVTMVQEQASDLSQQLRDLPSHYSAEWQVGAAAGYARVAANAYGAFLQRIAAVTEQLGRADDDTGAEVIELVTTMLAEHPWRRR